MGYIYKIWNDINDKVYIGKTLATIEKRWREHCHDMETRNCENRPLYRAMKKYGYRHFHIEEIEQCSNDIINERECYWIDFYDSYSNGYNATKGGDGKSYADVEAIITLWNEGKNIKEIFEITGHDHTTITKHLNDYGITSQNIKNRAIERQSKPVVKIDKITGEIIETFANAKEVEKVLQKTMASRHIYEVCTGQRKTAYGYKWKYLEDIK